MGSGKVVPWAKFEGIMKQPKKLEILDSPSQNPSGAPCSRFWDTDILRKALSK